MPCSNHPVDDRYQLLDGCLSRTPVNAENKNGDQLLNEGRREENKAVKPLAG